MTLHVHHLAGCSPVPLAHYLKALGILRLIAEQKDSNVRGWWEDECFHLATTLDKNELAQFFLKNYQPTPIIGPWNGGSGFYPKDNKKGINAIANSQAPRLSIYREAIQQAQKLTHGHTESPKKEDKNLFLQHCRQQWRGPLLDWFEAACVLTHGGDPTYPALLGTGGNDGRLDFTNNVMQRISELFDCTTVDAPATPLAGHQLDAAIYDQPEIGLKKSSPGQFFPGGAGGANSTTGFDGSSFVNSWDFVLMLEGAIVFASSVARRISIRALPQAAAPFAIRASASGFGSAADSDKNRGEQWMPLWRQPATFHELKTLIAQGRSQINQQTAGKPVDFGRAIARLGVARGIVAFERYGYIERNGQANLAVPLGRWSVQSQPHQDLIDQIANWVDRLKRVGTDKHAPASIGRVARTCEEAILACCRNGKDTRCWQDLLVALGTAETQLPRSPRLTACKYLRPLPELSSDWLNAVNDGSPELRMALALAGQHSHVNQRYPKDSIRRHFLPLDKKSQNTRHVKFNANSDTLLDSPQVVCIGNDLQEISISLVRRRIIEIHQHNLPHLPLVAMPCSEVSLEDIAQLLRGELNEAKILNLARPLMALNWRSFKKPWKNQPASWQTLGTLALYGLFRLTHWPSSLSLSPTTHPIHIRLDPAIYTRLAYGDLSRASSTAIKRLSASGLKPFLSQAVGTVPMARRLAMALAFPIHMNDAAKLAKRLTYPTLANHEEPAS